jgi:hypothetical protein
MKRPTMRVSISAFLSLLLSFLLVPDSVSVGAWTLVVNELMASNERVASDEQGDYDDWIELHNYGNDAVEAAGCCLSDDPADPTKWRIPATEPSATTIPAHGYLLVWADDEAGQGPLHASFKLGASGESVVLCDPQGGVLDQVTFGNQAPDTSYARLPDGNGPWRVCTAPTPGGSNDAGPGGLVISELLYHPYHRPLAPEDTRQEWIELLNRGSEPVRLAGWRLADGVDFAFPDVMIEAGGHLALAADVDVFRARHPDVQNVVGGWTGWLSNSGETLTLVNAAGAVVDSIRYADEGDWSVRELGPLSFSQRGWRWRSDHDGGGRSLEMIDPVLPGESGQNWAASLVDGGTPGRANSVASEDVAPLILKVRHSPIIPGPADAVTVTARLFDESPTGLTATLRYRIDASAYTDQSSYPRHDPGAYSSVPMFDDGSHRDGEAADGVFGAEIPAQADGQIVEFYVEARDAAGNSRTWPAPSVVDGAAEQVTNALYQVLGSFDPNAIWAAGSQPVYFLIMTEAERARLADIGNGTGGPGSEDDSDTNAEMNGTFISVDGTGVELRYQVGIRNRGKGSRDTAGGRYRNNYRVNFPTDDWWNGVTAINIKNRFGHVAVLGSAVWRMANLPAERITPIQVRVNGRNPALADSTMFGSYALVEVIDDEFAARHFPSDREGNAYRCANDVADLGFDGSDPNAYRAGYEKQTNAAANDYNDLIHLTYVLNNTPPERLVEEVRKVIHLEQWLRFLAVDALCGNREGGLTTPRGDDYAMYSGVTDKRFWLIPHDLDTVFGQGDNSPDIHRNVHVYAGLDGLRELLTHPDVLPLYHAQLLDLIDTVFSPQRFGPLVDHVLGGWVPEDTRTRIKQFVVQRNAAVLSQIPQQLTINSSLPIVNGYPYTTAKTYTLSGRAHAARTRSVLVNGVPASWSAEAGTYQSGRGFRLAESLVPAGSQWKFLDDGSDQGAAWRVPGFDDSAWRNGPAELGYGDNDEATVVNGGPAADRYVTTYFRKSFEVGDVSRYLSLRLRLLRDDGAVVYLNGIEICRSGMPEGPIGYTTLATANVAGLDESTYVEYEAPAALLLEGDNTLAVEIHQASVTSADLSFNLALDGSRLNVVDASLLPGINRIWVEAFDGGNGTGGKVEEAWIDLWYDDGDVSEISGTLESDTVLRAALGPWHVTSELTVPAGVTLQIEPGATLFFLPDASLVVRGRLIAEGSLYRRITFTRAPDRTNWAGLQFLDTQQESRLAYVNMEYCDAGSCAILADHARVSMDHVLWGNHTGQYLNFEDSSIVLKNSILPDIGGSELIHFWGFPPDGHAIFEGNRFGGTTGYNDIIDFTGGQRPGPIARFLNNTFIGGSDDCIDLDGADAHVEGNVFVHMRGGGNGDSLSHAVTTGTENNQYSELTVVRNLFYDVDHAMLAKDGGFITAVNNTIVKANRAAVNLYEARSGQWQGKGFYGDGNIFREVAHVFANPDWAGHPTAVTMNNSIFPTIDGDPVVWTGDGNLAGVDPQLVKASNLTAPLTDMRLLASSPAVGAGPNGRDMGGLVPPGASISGEPFPVTWRTTANLTVGGPDLFAYRYRVNDGPWSDEVSRPGAHLAGDPMPMPPIELINFQNGQSYTVFVVGKDSAGIWQSEQSPTASRTWIVDGSFRKLVLNEVLAINESAVSNGGTFPDMIELYYDGPAAISLSGMSLSDDPARPAKFVFPAGASMNPGGYLVLFADNETATSGHHLRFGLNAEGDGVYLYDRTGELIDSVEFGGQLPDLSVGRVGPEGLWHLTTPTFGQANLSHPLGDPRAIRINEWLAGESVLFESDFIELYNPHPLPVDLGGFYLTDTPETEPDLHRLPPLSFVAGGGYAVFTADGRRDPSHVEFKLSSDGDMIALFDAAYSEIDKVIFLAQTTDISQGRMPDGERQFEFFILPTPGLPNSTLPETTITTFALVPEGAAKRAIVPTSAGHVAEDWKTRTDFDDSAWLSVSGPPGGVGFERSSGYEQLIGLDIEATLYGRNATCYVRIPFHVDGDPAAMFSELLLSVRYDDGFVAYLNGTEVARVNAPATPQWNSAATGSHEASYSAFDERFDLSDRIDLLRTGDNLLAVQAMNSSTTSSDFVFSAAMEATSVVVTGGDYPYLNPLFLLEGLRVTELMYNAPQGEELDYIELQNVTTVPLDLTGVRFTAGVDFAFPSMTLDPGRCVVVVADRAAFRDRYGADIDVAGQYAGHLSNGGEGIVLKLPSPFEAAILRFRYADTWHPATDGGGESLAIKDSTAAAVTWGDPESWEPSQPSPGEP